MTQREQIQALLDEMASLRNEVASLKVQVAQAAAQPVHHHHHHYPPAPPSAPLPAPYVSPPWFISPNTCQGQLSVAGSAPDQTYNWGSS